MSVDPSMIMVFLLMIVLREGLMGGGGGGGESGRGTGTTDGVDDGRMEGADEGTTGRRAIFDGDRAGVEPERELGRPELVSDLDVCAGERRSDHGVHEQRVEGGRAAFERAVGRAALRLVRVPMPCAFIEQTDVHDGLEGLEFIRVDVWLEGLDEVCRQRRNEFGQGHWLMHQ